MLNVEKYGDIIRDYVLREYIKCMRDPSGILKYKFIVPGSVYSDELWDWDSWLTDIAISPLLSSDDQIDYEKGCVLNFLDHMSDDGKMPIWITSERTSFEIYPGTKNIHKPCLAQHALFISEKIGSASWLESNFDKLRVFVDWYEKNCLHESGLYVWLDDFAIGVDNDPCVFYRPDGSSASIYLNCLMYRELISLSKIASMLSLSEIADEYLGKANALKGVINELSYDERDGMFYNVDVNLVPIDPAQRLHSGAPRHWSTLIQRVDVWTGFMPMWAGIATEEQAKRMIERCMDKRTFYSNNGIRSLGKLEKMYSVKKSNNPSCWLGPIWVIANYMIFKGVLAYGYKDLAYDIAEKTVLMLGRDIEECGEMHEYYDPDTGEGVHNKGFQSWNLLSVELVDWLKANSK